MIFIDYLNTKNFLNEAMSSEFKGLVHPSLYKSFGDMLGVKGLPLQKAFIRELTEREMSSLHRAVLEKSLDKLMYDARFVVLVSPKDNKTGDANENVGYLYVIDRMDSSITLLSAEITKKYFNTTEGIDENGLAKATWKRHLKVVPTTTNIVSGNMKLAKEMENTEFKCFIFADEEHKLESHREKIGPELHDALKPFHWSDSAKMRQIEHEKEVIAERDAKLVEKTHDEFIEAIRQTKEELNTALGFIVTTGKNVKNYATRDKCLEVDMVHLENLIQKLNCIKEGFYSEIKYHDPNAVEYGVSYANNFAKACKELQSIKVAP